MNIVNFGYQHPAMFGLDEVVGSSAYGAGTLAAGDGSRQPSEAELSIAHAHGKHFGMVLKDCEFQFDMFDRFRCRNSQAR